MRNLPKSQSDHCPILISSSGFAPIPRAIKPFRFQAAWLNHQAFYEFVRKNWNSGAPIVPFLKQFAEKLNKWNREEFYNIFRKKSELWARISGVQTLLSKGRQTHLIKLEAKLRREMMQFWMMRKHYGFKSLGWMLFVMGIVTLDTSTFLL